MELPEIKNSLKDQKEKTFINLLSVNPFITSGPVRQEMFFGREQEIRQITENINKTSFAVIGGRRIGKTSVLHRLHQILPKLGYFSLLFDCISRKNHEDVLSTKLHSWKPKTPSSTIQTFGDLLQYSGNLNPIVILMDEADRIVPFDQENGWPLFKALRTLSITRRAQIVLAGERSLRSAIRDVENPLYNLASEITLGCLDENNTRELITIPMKRLQIEFKEEEKLVQRIYSFTSGHPNIIQRLCQRLIDQLNREKSRRIFPEHVEAIIGDPVFLRDDFLKPIWEKATLLEKIISLLLTEEESVWKLKEVRNLINLRCNFYPKAKEIDEALQNLVHLRSILTLTPEGYQFKAKGFPMVVASTLTMEDQLEVLTDEYKEYAA